MNSIVALALLAQIAYVYSSQVILSDNDIPVVVTPTTTPTSSDLGSDKIVNVNSSPVLRTNDAQQPITPSTPQRFGGGVNSPNYRTNGGQYGDQYDPYYRRNGGRYGDHYDPYYRRGRYSSSAESSEENWRY